MLTFSALYTLSASLPMLQIGLFLFLLVWRALQLPLTETASFRIASVSIVGSLTVLGVLTFRLLFEGENSWVVNYGHWFGAGEYHFDLLLQCDALGVTYGFFSLLLLGVIAVFSRRYLHRERGFHRFYQLLMLFQFGVTLVCVAGSLEMLVIGWEAVGLASVMLIAFFHYRPAPVRNSFWVFCIYRCGDFGLLSAILVMHHHFGNTQFIPLTHVGWTGIANSPVALTLGLLLFLPAMAKSAQFPFCNWLPRAMEGPTPSSAIFYGAVSVHLGPLLLLRCSDMIAESVILATVIVAVGLATALLARLISQSTNDIKGVIAYGSVMQLGLITVEIGLGLNLLALIHILGHGFFRTLQVLRSPSILADRQRLEQMLGAHLTVTEANPTRWGRFLYRMALERGYLDVFLRDYLLAACLWPVRQIHRFDSLAHHMLPASVESKEHDEIVSWQWRSRLIAVIVVMLIVVVGSILLLLSQGDAMLPWQQSSMIWRDAIVCALLSAGLMAVLFTPLSQAKRHSYLFITLLVVLLSGWILSYAPDIALPGNLPLWALIPLCCLLLGLFPFSGMYAAFFERTPEGMFAILAVTQACGAYFLFKGAAPIEGLHLPLAGLALLSSLLAVVQYRPKRVLAYLLSSLLAMIAYAANMQDPAISLGGRELLLTFMIAGIGFVMMVSALEARTGKLADLRYPSGAYDAYPALALSALLFGLIATGLPLSLGYIAGDLILAGSYAQSPVGSFLWLGVITLNAVTVMRLFLYLFNGNPAQHQRLDLRKKERLVTMLALSALFFTAILAA